MPSIPGFLGPEQLPECLKGCDVVVIPAGVPRKPGVFSPGLRCRVSAVLLFTWLVLHGTFLVGWDGSGLVMTLP